MENRKRYIVADRNVVAFARMLYPDTPLLPINVCERTKTIETVVEICRWLLEENADRDSLLVSVGGGCTSDVAGFAAGIYKRGIRHAICPTTLLSMVDASIGGKTGVNLDGYKNMLGLFHAPYFVKPVYEALETLPRREFVSGVAEMLKTFLISDGGLYRDAVRVFSGCDRPGTDVLKPLIEAASFIKQEITERDPRDRKDRRLLNFGHTVAHAIEWWQASHQGLEYTHGEAVSIGIIEAVRLSEELGVCAPGLRDSLKADFTSCGLPTELPCPLTELGDAISRDKKSTSDKIGWVLLRRPGKAEVRMI